METEIIPRFIEDKTTKGGVRFATVEDTDKVRYTAWDEDIISALKERIGKATMCEVIAKGEYKNIRAVYKTMDKKGEPVSVSDERVKENPIKTYGDANRSIIAQCLTKCLTKFIIGLQRDVSAEEVNRFRKDILGTYNYFLENL